MATVDYSNVRDVVQSLIQSVPDVGQVHNRIRRASDWRTLLSLFTHEMSDGSGTQIRGWMFSRISISDHDDDSRFGAQYRGHHFRIIGVMAFNDELDTETQFQELIDKVVVALSDGGSGNFNNVDSYTIPYSPNCSVGIIDLRQFGTVICHYVEINYRFDTESDD